MPKICLLKLRTRFKIPLKDERCLGILGSHEITGAWDESRPIFASEIEEDSWEASFRMISGTHLEWKWVVYDKHKNKVLQWEVRDNRTLVVPDTCCLISTQFDGEQCDIISQKEGLVEATKSVERPSFSSPEECDKRGTSTSNESRNVVYEAPPSSGMLAETSSENGNQILFNSYVNAAEDINREYLRATLTEENEFVSLTSDELGESDKDVATPEIYFEKIAAAVNGHSKESMLNMSNGKEQTPAILEMHRMNDKKIPSTLELPVGKESNVEASGNKHNSITPNASVEKRKMNQPAPLVAKKNEPSVLLRETVQAASKMYTGRETGVSPTCELSHETDKQFKLPVSAKIHFSTQSTSLVSYSNKATEITSELTEGIGEGVPSETGASNGSGDSFSRGSKDNSNKMEMFSADIHGRNTKYVIACASTATQTSPRSREDNIASANSTQISPSVNKKDTSKKDIQSGHWPYHWSSSLLLVPAAILATAALTYLIYRKSR